MGNTGRIVYGVTACVAISIAAISFAWGEEEIQRDYNIMGRKVVLERTVITEKDVAGKRIWRILFPIKTGEGWNGFCGYCDFLKKEIPNSDLYTLNGPIAVKVNNGEEDTNNEEPVFKEGPFLEDDFLTAMDAAEDKSPIIIVDMNSFFNIKEKGPKYLINVLAEDYSPVGGKPPDLKNPADKYQLRRLESKYAALIPEKTYAGWADERFNVRMAAVSELGFEPEGPDEDQSFILFGGEFYPFKKHEKPPEDSEVGEGIESSVVALYRSSSSLARSGDAGAEGGLKAGRDGAGIGTTYSAYMARGRIAAAGFKAAGIEAGYSADMFGGPVAAAGRDGVESETADTDHAGKDPEGPSKWVSYFVIRAGQQETVRVQANVPHFHKSNFADQARERGASMDLVTCWKIEASDPLYMPGYIVSETRLFEGEIVSVVNTEYGSKVYFNTNMIEKYIVNLIKRSEAESGKVNPAGNRDISEDKGSGAKSAVKKTTIRFKIIRGEEDKPDGVKSDSDPGDIKIPCSERRYLNKKERSEVKAQAYVRIPRQLKKGERVKLEILEDGEIPVLTIDEELKEVKGSAFKDERNLALQALFEHELDAKNVRVMADYSDYLALCLGRWRWSGHLDLVNSDAKEEEYVKVNGKFLHVVETKVDTPWPRRLSLGLSGNFSDFPTDPEELRHAGGGAVSEVNYYVGNIPEQKYLGRVSFAPEVDYEWNSKLNLAAPGAAASDERIERWWWRFQLPITASYNFDGVRFEGKFAPSYINDGAREMFGVKTHVPLSFAFTASLDPKFVHGLPRGLDSQSAVAVNLTYELGRSPPKFEEVGNKFSLGFEYAPVTK